MTSRPGPSWSLWRITLSRISSWKFGFLDTIRHCDFLSCCLQIPVSPALVSRDSSNHRLRPGVTWVWMCSSDINYPPLFPPYSAVRNYYDVHSLEASDCTANSDAPTSKEQHGIRRIVRHTKGIEDDEGNWILSHVASLNRRQKSNFRGIFSCKYNVRWESNSLRNTQK